MDYPEEKTVGENTLLGAIKDLEKVSWKLNGQIYGEMPSSGAQGINPTPADKLTFARNSIVEITQRLREVSDRLELIGK